MQIQLSKMCCCIWISEFKMLVGSAMMMFDQDWNQKWDCCKNQKLSGQGYNKYIPLLKDTLDMAYEITQLIKKSPKREAEFHRKQTVSGTNGTWFPCIRYGLTNSENSLPNKMDCLSGIFECSSLKNYETLMKLWGWAHDNISDSDMKERIIGVQTKMQNF